MPFDEAGGTPRRSSALVAGLWILGIAAASSVLVWLSLPAVPEFLGRPVTARDLFHREWFVVATLLVFPVYSAARSSWVAALPVVAIASAQMVYLAATAVDRLHAAGLASAASDVWYVVAASQVVMFVVAGIVGGHHSFADRRWQRLIRALFAEPRLDSPSDK